MRFGKLTTEELRIYVLEKLRKTRPEVVLSAAEGEDCAALLHDGLILMSSDPITAAVPLSTLGELSVHINCNDIAANGGEPVAMMLTIIVPPGTDPKDIGVITGSAVQAAATLDVDIIGGHTEFSDCVVRPITCSTAIGFTSRIIAKENVRAGDCLGVTKSLGMEGMRILLEATHDTDNEYYRRYANALSVVPESKILSRLDCVTMMHDITEGGVLGAVAEIFSTRLGARLETESFPVDVKTRLVCEKYGVDPLRLLSSGSMLFASNDMDRTICALKQAGINACSIGTVCEGGVRLNTGEIIRVERDSLYDFWERNQ